MAAPATSDCINSGKLVFANNERLEMGRYGRNKKLGCRATCPARAPSVSDSPRETREEAGYFRLSCVCRCFLIKTLATARCGRTLNPRCMCTHVDAEGPPCTCQPLLCERVCASERVSHTRVRSHAHGRTHTRGVYNTRGI